MSKKVQPPVIYDEYFALSEKHIAQCGEKTVVLMQLGDFYEMYDYPDPTHTLTHNSVHEIVELCSLATSCSRSYKGLPLMMAGVHVGSIDKYVQIIVEGGYNAVVYVQTNEYEESTKKLKRILHEIHSPSTYIHTSTHNEVQMTNHVMCIWIESHYNVKKHPNQIVYGAAVLNNYDGKSYLFESTIHDKLQCTSFDELENFVSIYRPRECIVICKLKYEPELNEKIYNTVLEYSGLAKLQDITHIHKYSHEKKEVINCEKQAYIQHILDSHFGDDCLFQCSQFMQYTYATQSFCFLLHFIEERNRSLIKHIYMPIFMNLSKHVVLANHTLKQLNILSDQNENGKECGHLQSVHTFLNKCCTAIGKRRFHYLITHPTFNEEWLEDEYSIMNELLKTPENKEMICPLRSKLSQVLDLERILKQISLSKLTPNVLFKTYTSISVIDQLYICLLEMPYVVQYLRTPDFVCRFVNTTSFTDDVQLNITKLKSLLEDYLFLDKCVGINSLSNFDVNIIKPGMCEMLDKMVEQHDKCNLQLDALQTFFESCMPSSKSSSVKPECIKRNITEKNGISLQLTKTRSETLKKQFMALSGNDLSKEVILDHGLRFLYKDVQFVTPGKTSMEIRFPLLDSICTNITRLKNGINEQIRIQYLNLLSKIDNEYSHVLEQCSLFVGKLDVLLCKCYSAYKYNYSRPIIDKYAPKSFMDAKEVRHVLIEQLLTQETYVPNDICLGWREKTEPLMNVNVEQEIVDGILLFGTNAVGKTSLIRALGIVLIMAQCGMYVPCSRFTYKPYRSMYSRILNNDNLFKGLSTFAVEMAELRVILENADENSFIMGDELCSGTETESALSIVMASLEHLHDKESTFMFATHFHEIVDYEEMRVLNRIRLKHLEVTYDETTNDLIYERKIQDGPGKRTYGLEVCKALFMKPEFLNRSYELRTKYFEHTQGPLSIESSRYNVKKLKGACEKCGAILKTNEIHHIEEQQNADRNGFIGSLHKNHIGNLMTLCQKCHDDVHHPSNKIKKHSDNNGSPDTCISDLTPCETENDAKVKKKIIRRKKTSDGYKVLA